MGLAFLWLERSLIAGFNIPQAAEVTCAVKTLAFSGRNFRPGTGPLHPMAIEVGCFYVRKAQFSRFHCGQPGGPVPLQGLSVNACWRQSSRCNNVAGSQTVSVPENLEILIPWRIITDTSEKKAEPLTAELSSELSLKHVLYGLRARAVAARIDRDDVLFEIEGADMVLAVVHLTWRKESDPRWPTTRFFASWEQWVRNEMLPAHQEYSP